jgi:uncharacterized DUF497 family protein
MALVFERDPKKAASNRRKHKVSFEEAEAIFGDPYELMIPDPDHSQDEERSISIGESHRGRILTVVYTQIGNAIRLISARDAEPDEIAEYRERRGG